MFLEKITTRTVAELIEYTPQQLINEIVSLQASLHNVSKTLDAVLKETARDRRIVVYLLEAADRYEKSLITAAISMSPFEVRDDN